MKIAIFLLYFGTVLTYDGKSSPNLFHPALPGYRRLPSFQSEGFDRRTNQGVFFQPATILPRFDSGLDHSNDQVLNSQREKRDATGALHIVTNHAAPIYADVKPDGTSTDVTQKVTAPEDTFYELKSLRKSWPLPNKLELIRSISRVITLAVLVSLAIVEFFPLLSSLFSIVYSFIYV